MNGGDVTPADVVVLRGAPDADELAALVVALSARSAGRPVAPERPVGRPGGPAAPRGRGITDNFWFAGYSPHRA